MKIADFVTRGINVINDMGEDRKTREGSIVFSNGWVASIIDKEKSNYTDMDKRFSIAVCDYNGYFNWEILKPFGAGDKGSVKCDTEDEVCNILTVIELLK